MSEQVPGREERPCWCGVVRHWGFGDVSDGSAGVLLCTVDAWICDTGVQRGEGEGN